MPRDDDRDADLTWLSAQLSDDPAGPVDEAAPVEPASPRESSEPATETKTDAPGDVSQAAAPEDVPEPTSRTEPVAPAPADEVPATPSVPWWTTPIVSAAAEARPSLDVPTAVLPQPLTPPVNGARAVQASEAMPVAALQHSSGRRVGIEAKRPSSLVLVLSGLVVVIVLVGLFFVGQRLGGGTPVAVATPTSTPAATPTPTPTPTAAAEITAMQSAGVHPWNTLFGGECLEPYDSPWAEEFTVADCAAAHTAQLVFRGAFDGDAAAAFPGEAELASQINVLCSAAGLIDLTAAAALADVQVQGSYPVSDEQWTAGERHYYCFVSRSTGEPLTGSLAGPGPAA